MTSFPNSGSPPKYTMAPTGIGEDEVLIAVMGQTGSGKTTFINTVTQSDLTIGNGLESCTSIVQTAPPFELDGRQVVLVDTPGFDDTYKSDTEILRMIALYLSKTYNDGKKLAGVLYLHRISDVRMGGIATQNFRMFRDICGDKSLKNVIIVTTMWSKVDEMEGVARERELMSKEAFFKPALGKGAQMGRHDNTAESARNIIRQILKNRPLSLRIQEELVDEKKDLADTTAGSTLNKEMKEIAERHSKEIENLKKELEEAIKTKDEETRQELEEERKKHQATVDRLLKDAEQMSTQFRADRERLESAMKEIDEMKKQGSHITLYSPFSNLRSRYDLGPAPCFDFHGDPTFFASAYIFGGLHPCKVGFHLTHAHVPHDGKEHLHRGTVVLLPYAPHLMVLVKASGNQFPSGRRLVVGGYESDGKELYHAVAMVGNVMVPGKVGRHIAGAHVGFGGKEHVVKNYEILCWR